MYTNSYSDMRTHQVKDWGCELQMNGSHVDIQGRQRNRCCDYTSYIKTPMFQPFKCLFYSMKLFGLYHTRAYAAKDEYGNIINIPPLFKQITPSFVYQTVILILLWINTLRLFSAFDSGDTFGALLFMKFCTLIWFTLCALNATACWLGSKRSNNIPEFFMEWSRLREDFPEAQSIRK